MRILLGVTGGIAAYKAMELTRLLVRLGHNVQVVMTKNAMEFVTPMSFEVLSNQEVITQTFEAGRESKISHINLARGADNIVIAPATANFMAKLAQGIADDMLSTICLASDKPIYVVPAMNQQMWAQTSTQSNLKKLKSNNIKIIGPSSGEQACGENGFGRMLEPQKIIKAILEEQILYGRKILITAGTTEEPLDPVRFLSSHSSGKMGYALAHKARDLGAEVYLISGPSNLSTDIKNYYQVRTASEMYKKVQNILKKQKFDMFISAAAVVDFKFKTLNKQKIKTQDLFKNSTTTQLTIEKNVDILTEVANTSYRPKVIVGFALETENLITNAQQKLQTKNLDIIIGNDAKHAFNSDENEVIILSKMRKNQKPLKIKKTSKAEIAQKFYFLYKNYL